MLKTCTLLSAATVGSAASSYSHRYFKFTVLDVANATRADATVQLSEFLIGMDAVLVNYTDAVATNPGGNNPSGEEAPMAIDNSTATKWLDFTSSDLIIDFQKSVTMNSYTFITANDYPERTPRNWVLYGSDDDTTYVKIDSQNMTVVPDTALTQLEWICVADAGCLIPTAAPTPAPTQTPEDDDDFCFHVDSKIDYKGVEYTYEELKAGKEPECTVPHTPASKGVVITTSCDKTVRVTDTHLMATTKGFQLAYSLKAGDVLFGDYDKDECIVQSVEKEKTTQQYFGLNCVHSEVLTSGLRASTFGDFHTLPSWYMTYVGGLVGSETASSLGEYIAEWYFQHQ